MPPDDDLPVVAPDQQALNEANERLRLTLAAAGATGTWDWDIARHIFYPDARFASLYGFDHAQAAKGLPTAAFFSAIHPDDLPRIRIAVAGILAGAELFSKEFRIVTKGGATIWVHARGRCHFDQQDQPARFTGLLVDITEQKRTEEQLRIAQTAGGIGTFEYVAGFATATVSPQFCTVLGLHPTRILPIRTINGVVCEGHAPIIPEGDSARDGGPETMDGEICVIRPDDGRRIWIARRGEIVGGPGNSDYRLMGVLYDITGSKLAAEELRVLNETLESRVQQEIAVREEAEDALRQAQKMEAIGQLTGGIAHDFNNLLTIIIGNIDTVARRLSGADPRTQRALGNALKGAERAAALTQRLLAFSRRQPLDPKPVDIGRLMDSMSDLLHRSIGEAVLIDLKIASDVWRIEADPNQLENAILNLAVNARDAMSGEGRLTIVAANRDVPAGSLALGAAMASGQYVVISVTDTGSGMTAETIARAFDPFFTTKEVGKGTGLGLSMVYGFVKQSGGSIDVQSKPGAGTTIALFLPRLTVETVDEIRAEEDRIEPGRRTETVLVVEDDDDVRTYTVETLRELGYRVIEAHDGPSALRLMERQETPIQLLLTDVVMPNMSGQDLANTARQLQPGLKVLFNSGYTRNAIMTQGRLAPGVDLLSKPFTFAVLAGKVRELLDRDSE